MKRKWQLWAVAAMLGSSGCMVGPKYTAPTAPAPPAFKETPAEFKEGDGWKRATPGDDLPRGRWWEIYGDAQLNALEEQVSVSNQNLKAAEARYRQARDTLQNSRGAQLPTVTLTPGITNSQSSGTLYSGGQLATLVQQRTIYALSAGLNWEADVWGRIRHLVNQNVATAQASAADLETARLSYQAALASNYFALRGIDAAARIYDETVKLYEESLGLTRDRVAAGVATDADVAQAETQLATARAARIDLGVTRAQYEHAIAVLAGKAPAELSIAPMPLTMKVPDVPVHLPSELLERRPDIAAAERRVAAANEAIGAATAAFYPTIGLNASTGFQTSDVTQWLNWPSRFWSIGPSAAATLFDNGRRRATVNLNKDLHEETVATYRQTVLGAFQQVEDNLAALRILKEEMAAQALAVSSSARALDVVTAQYQAGTQTYLQVITAQTAALAAQQTAVNLLSRRMSASVLLVQAVGGGWERAALPGRTEVMKKP